MATVSGSRFVIFILTIFLCCCAVYCQNFEIVKQTPGDCNAGNGNSNDFFDISQLRCEKCAQTGSSEAVVTSPDGRFGLLFTFMVHLM